MSFTDEYRELIEHAEEAVRALLNAAEPDSWMRLRNGYGQLKSVVAADDELRQRESQTEQARSQKAQREGQREKWEDEQRQQRELRAEWRAGPPARREGMLLQALGDEHLIIRELTSRLNAELATPAIPQVVYESDTRRVVTRMLRAGQLDRAPEPFMAKCATGTSASVR